MNYTVQNAPFPLKQLNVLYGTVLGLIMYLINRLYRLTLRIEYVGKEHLNESPNHINAFWHENLLIYFVVNLRFKQKQIWLQHPMLFMKPVHVLAKLMGVNELAYGSSGNKGKAALDRVMHQLKNGYSTMINPDGPTGPSKKLKPGVLIMAKETGVPIIPITMRVSSQRILSTWDRKRLPLPFSKIRIEYHRPIYISEDITDADINNLESVLSKP